MLTSVCVVCGIENEDHHCIWLNNCIGKRNYSTFFTFVVSCVILCCYAIAFSLTHVLLVYAASEESFQASLLHTPISFFIAIFCCFLLFPVGCLTGYHCFLVMRGVTTHEQVSVWLFIVFFFSYGKESLWVLYLYILVAIQSRSDAVRRPPVQFWQSIQEHVSYIMQAS